MGRLTKYDAEALMALVDTEPVGVLTRMLQKVLDRPDATWAELVDTAPLPPERKVALLARDPEALYDLAAELNELRTLDAATP
ncbi:MAG TPA: hypothetical protein VF855_01465 [Acidimicrobiales bacterium]